MRNVYTVGQVNAYIKNMFTQDYMLSRIYVKGEVSNCKYHTSGHIYFSLKDESGTIACVMFAGQRGGLSFRMSEGQQVVVFGAVNVYERSGSCQLYAKEIRLDGEGVLYERFQALKQELEEMGMFAPEYKKRIPDYARKVGVVTAPTGAAIRDIINISRRRNPYVQFILYPALVQGEGAKESIVRGIQMLGGMDIDILIVGRGGGSMEDLWAFNEECVARAIFDCPVPVISAVGHETDTTIADYVADLRAPTPSAAAELAVFDYYQMQKQISEYQKKFYGALYQKVRLTRAELEKYETKLRFLHPVSRLRDNRFRLADMEDRLRGSMRERMISSRHRFQVYVERIGGLSPLKKLSQGYAYVQEEKGKALKSICQVKKGDQILIHVTDGIISARAEEIKEERHD